MFKQVRPYMGEYIKYTWAAVGCCAAAVVLGVIPFFLVYRLILPLIEGRELGLGYAAGLIGLSAVCMVLHGLLYVQGLEFSHISAFHTLKNLRIALQRKLEAQPLGASGAFRRRCQKIPPTHAFRMCHFRVRRLVVVSVHWVFMREF